MKVGELYDVIEDVRFQVVEYDPAAWTETVLFDNGDEAMYEKGLDEQVANATVETVYSFVDETEEVVVQANIRKYPSE